MRSTTPDRIISFRFHRGFTLVEMMMTLLLSGVLLAGLWNLFTSYTRLFEAGQQQAAESRLARAVLDQIAADLAGVADVSLPENLKTSAVAGSLTSSTQDQSVSSPVSSLSTLPQFRLMGTEYSLRVHTYKPGTPRLPRDEDDETGALSDELEKPEFYAPDLRVILYDFTVEEDEIGAGDSLPTGLIRRELDWQSALALNSDEEESESELALEEEELTSDDQQFLSDDLLGDMERYEIVQADLQNDQFHWVPEIVKMKFRYSDGKTWSESWDSRYRKALPMLIEVSLDFDYQKGIDARYPIEEDDGLPTTTDLEEDEEALDPEENLNTLLNDGEEELPQYRRVIALSAAFQSPTSSSSSTDGDTETALDRLQAAEEETP
ncbi:MAG: prepilin-type N-terminal cleavage/methylation domain-containing protein [Planctomycetaceae bacterium]